MSRFVELVSYQEIYKAYLVKSYLDENGITCFVKDENITAAHPFYSQAVGGVKVMVPEDEMEEALELLKNFSI
jgi:hypothetical protein